MAYLRARKSFVYINQMIDEGDVYADTDPVVVGREALFEPAAVVEGVAGTPLSLDNTIDPPSDITSLVAAGATVVGSEATLRGKDFYAQDTDPGAVGAGSVWKDTSGPEIFWLRNATDDGWEPTFRVTVVATGADTADARSNAEVVDGQGYIGGVVSASDSGSVDATMNATTADGFAITGGTAATSGTGAAEYDALASSLSGLAGMKAEADAVSARLGFNGTPPIAQPVIPAVPNAQDIADVLVALGLATQTP